MVRMVIWDAISLIMTWRHCNGTFGWFGQGGRLQERGFSSQFKCYGKLVLLHFKVSYRCKILHLPRQTSVMPCAQFHTSDFTTTWLKTERNFHFTIWEFRCCVSILYPLLQEIKIFGYYPNQFTEYSPCSIVTLSARPLIPCFPTLWA